MLGVGSLADYSCAPHPRLTRRLRGLVRRRLRQLATTTHGPVPHTDMHTVATSRASLAEVQHWLHTLYVGIDEARLRDEDRRKAREVVAMLAEVERAMHRLSRRQTFVLVDAAAGKSYVGLLAAKLVLEPYGRSGSVVTLERDAGRVAASRAAFARLATRVPVDCRVAEVSDHGQWPLRPSLVVALHACGPAADEIIEAAVVQEARALLLVPCCTSRLVPSASHAEAAAERLGLPRHAPVRRRFVQSWVDSVRTLRLESLGYQTEVVEFVGATVTPHNLLWRAHRVREPRRMAEAARRLERLQQ